MAHKNGKAASHTKTHMAGNWTEFQGGDEEEGMLRSTKDEGDNEDEDEGDRRHKWASKREYLLSTIGFCVGIGNLFRFPYLCNRNGGGAFLIPFALSLFLLGLPLFALEAVIGQFSGRDAIQVWSICPLFKGSGIATVILAAICYWYYTVLLVWAFYFLGSSFTAELPWSRCDGWWNTPQCFSDRSAFTSKTNESSLNVTSFLGNSSVSDINADEANTSYVAVNVANNETIKLVSAAEEFWQHNVLQISSGLGDPGSMVWYLVVSLLVTQVLMFLTLIKGVRSSGKVVYVTATLPYILVTVLLVRGATLPGALDGILFYIKPDFSKLLNGQVWMEAALQVFFSLGPCWGGLVVMASFNKFNNNCLRDSLLLTMVCEGTSVYGGFAIFSILGYMAHISGVDISEVVSSGPGLAFIVYPEAITLLPLPQLWAILFFLMVITLAVDSQMTFGEVFITTALSPWPKLRRWRMTATAISCVLIFLLCLPLTTQGGMYLFQITDWFIGAFSVLVVGILECVVIGWIYGIPRFSYDIYLMVGYRPPLILTLLWRFVTPVLCIVLLVFTLLNYTPPTYGDYHYDTAGKAFGWFIATVSIVSVPTYAVYTLWKAKGSLIQRIRHSLKPDDELWKPCKTSLQQKYRNEVLLKYTAHDSNTKSEPVKL